MSRTLQLWREKVRQTEPVERNAEGQHLGRPWPRNVVKALAKVTPSNMSPEKIARIERALDPRS